MSRELPQRSTLNTSLVALSNCYPLAQFQPYLLVYFFVYRISAYWFSFCSKLATLLSIRSSFCPAVASNFYFSWDECPTNLWTLPTFSGGPATTKRVSLSDPLVSSPSFPAPPRDGLGTVFLPGEEVFACPRPAAPSQVPQTRYPYRQWAPPHRLDLWPLLLPAEARARGEPCGHLPTSLLTARPVECTPPPVYSTCI